MRAAILLILLIAAASPRARRVEPRFYDDDPIAREPESQEAANVTTQEVSLVWDTLYHLFALPRNVVGSKAGDVNSVDEVPDSSWFVNRAGAATLTVGDVERGPDTTSGPARGALTIISGKSDGISPGFVLQDTAAMKWFVKLDARQHPELASGAEVVSTKLLWALGYHVPENHIASFRPEELRIKPGATFKDASGRKHLLTMRDARRLLAQAERGSDGTYRMLASKALDGRPVGPFLYQGTRRDDPNDVIAHEERRTLRGLRAFAAWLNHVDAKALNTLDTVVSVDGHQVVRHHLLDFGSTLGSAAVRPRDYQEGHEYLYEPRALGKATFSAGLLVPYWRRIKYDAPPAIGRFTADGFDPRLWKPRIPNPAFLQAQPDDLFWAARKLAGLSPQHIEAAVRSARYSHPAAARYLVNTLVARRRVILRTFLPAINPIVAPVLSDDGLLRFENAAVEADVARQPAAYVSSWYAYDNESDSNTPLGHVRGVQPLLRAPAALPTDPGAFVHIEVSAIDHRRPEWSSPVHLFFRREGSGWRLVGLDREIDRE